MNTIPTKFEFKWRVKKAGPTKFYLTVCRECGDWIITKGKGTRPHFSAVCSDVCLNRGRLRRWNENMEHRLLTQGGWVATGRAAKGVNHASSVEWNLVSPDGQQFDFKNLTQFVREHEHLFDSNDCVWKRRKSCSTLCCNAVDGLKLLSPRRKHSNLSWKGWIYKISSHDQTLKPKNSSHEP